MRLSISLSSVNLSIATELTMGYLESPLGLFRHHWAWLPKLPMPSFIMKAQYSSQANARRQQPAAEHKRLFQFTSGRWLQGEQFHLNERYFKFNVQGLQHVAGQMLGSQCVEITKPLEGLYSKVLALKMENGEEIWAKVQNPKAGSPHYMVASEVATLDFLRNVLDAPVPKVLDWSLKPNPVETEYILIEKPKGRRLKDAWVAMQDLDARLNVMNNVVRIEKKLVETRLAHYGSLYYKDFYPEGKDVIDPAKPVPGLEMEAASRFVIGPTTESFFCSRKGQEPASDRGPWKTAQEYFSAGADYDITLVQNAISKTTESAQIIATGKKHKRHLQQFKAILPYILPPEEISYPVLFHLDLNPYNTFVDSADPTKVSCIIDWQPPFAAPLLLQAKYPSLSYYDTPCPLLGKLAEMAGLVGEYPDPHLDGILMDAEFANTKPPTLREFYELSSMMGNPTLSKLLSIKDENKQPVLARAADADPDLLQPLLIHIHKRWNRLMEQWQSTAAGGEDQPRPTIPCPISFSKEEINEFRRGTKKDKNMDKSTVSMPLHCLSSDGCLPNEEYEAIVRILKNL